MNPRLVLPLTVCGIAAAFAATGACLTHPAPTPPLQTGRYVLTTSSGSPLPATFNDSGGRQQRIFGDTIDVNTATRTYTEHGRVALILADGSAQQPQSFTIGPQSYTAVNDFAFDLPSTILGAVRGTPVGNPGAPQIQLSKPGVYWLYTLR